MSNRKSRALPALDLLYNLAGRFDAGLGRIVAGEHAGDFQDVFPLREAPDLGNRAAVHFFLINEVMVVGNGRRLWQVGNAEDLALPGELPLMPTSISSKIMVLPVVRSGPAVFRARAIRDTSPPEAIFAKGCMASPVLAEK